jgi:CHAD domain-containing protein
MNGWHRFLDTGIEAGTEAPLASSAINNVAGPRILKASKRIWKRGRGIGADAPAAVFHRIRIDGKKLRYLLEFFSGLYPGSTASRFIKELKKLQDILGDINDTEIQLAYIGEFVETCTASARALAATSLLSEYIAERQRVLRAEFVDRFASFASKENLQLHQKNFGGK